MEIISIDIGSTFTKGIRVSIRPQPVISARNSHPTTRDNIETGFRRVVEALGGREDVEIFVTSSAKGGLSICAIGIVPQLTLKMAKQAALSAGGKIDDVFPYKLTGNHIRKLERNPPDIILMTGGTDGGNEEFNLHNAEMLSQLKSDVTIVYAGNRVCVEKVKDILSGKRLIVADNVLPDLESPNPKDARQKIRQVYIDLIIKGKGLSSVLEYAARPPLPTPYMMFEYIRKFSAVDPDWDSFCLVDLGGATTDVYSRCSNQVSTGTILKGLPDPDPSRTVEGDLGLRLSADSTFKALNESGMTGSITDSKIKELFEIYLAKIKGDLSFIPKDDIEIEFDRQLAECCITQSIIRHSGRIYKTFLPSGEIFIQEGKDLREVKRLVYTGGYLSRLTDNPVFNLNDYYDENGREILCPRNFEIYTDREYILPMLAGISDRYPEEAVRLGIEHLR